MDKQLIEINPPKWADRFFEWYCNPDMQEEIQGDLYESFMDRVENDSLRQAKLWYWGQVVLFMNRRTLSRKKSYSTRLNSIDMFRNYFKIGFRNILKNKGTTFINAFGMALTIGCCLVVFQFVDFIYNVDDFHSKRDEIYLVQRVLQQNGEHITWNDVPQPLADALVNDFAQIENRVRVNYQRGIIKYEDKVFAQRVSFVDDAYFDIFDFPIKWGNKANFTDPEGIVLGIRTAEKYFGSKNPIGEELSIRFNVQGDEILEQFIVKGVLEKTPQNAGFSDNVLIPFARQKVLIGKMEDWKATVTATFIQVKNPAGIETIKAKETPYLKIINNANKEWNAVGLHFQPLTGMWLNSRHVRNFPFGFTDKAAIYFLVSIGFILLLLACFNYINIALASAGTRLKEISVRKVMGSSRQQIIWQFLTENLLICMIAMIIGIFLAYGFFLPWFNDLINGLPLDFSVMEKPSYWLLVFGLTLLTALGGAGYPALYISKLQPNAILKRDFKLGDKSGFRKILIGFQLGLTIIAIFMTFAILIDSKKQNAKEWGYNQKDLLVIQLPDAQAYESFKNDIATNPNVLEVAGSKEWMGVNASPLKVEVEGTDYNVQSLHINDNYLETYGIDLLDGRNFSQQFEADQRQSVLVNETFKKTMNWQQAVGQNFRIDNQTYHVVGEVKDFHFETFYFQVKPMVMQLAAPSDMAYVSVRSQTGTAETTIKELEKNWKKIYPNTPYSYAFQDKVFFIYFDIFRQTNGMMAATAFLTILLSIIGFFGLAMLLLNRKMKELSIRKILGANFFHLSHLINKEFILPLIGAIIIGLPTAFFLTRGLLLSVISPNASIGFLPFLLTIGSIFLMLVLSLSKHIYTAVVSEPSQFLKDE